MAIHSSRIKTGTSQKKSSVSKKALGATKKAPSSTSALGAEGPSIAVTLFGKIKETEPMYTAQVIDALFERQQTTIDAQENKKKLALETIKTIAELGQNSSLRETIAVVKGIGAMLQSLYDAMDKEATSTTTTP